MYTEVSGTCDKILLEAQRNVSKMFFYQMLKKTFTQCWKGLHAWTSVALVHYLNYT